MGARIGAPLLGTILGSFKSAATKRINEVRNTPGLAFWQRNHWEHVIRDDESLRRIRATIEGNPARWLEDEMHPNMPARHTKDRP